MKKHDFKIKNTILKAWTLYNCKDSNYGTEKNIDIMSYIFSGLSIFISIFVTFISIRFSYPLLLGLFSGEILLLSVFFNIFKKYIYSDLNPFWRTFFFIAALLILLLESPLILSFLIISLLSKLSRHSIDDMQNALLVIGIDISIFFVSFWLIDYLLRKNINIFFFLENNTFLKEDALSILLLILLPLVLCYIASFLTYKIFLKESVIGKSLLRLDYFTLLIFAFVFFFLASFTNAFNYSDQSVGDQSGNIINIVTLYSLCILLTDKAKEWLIKPEENKEPPIVKLYETKIVTPTTERIKKKKKTYFKLNNGKLSKETKEEIIKEPLKE